MGVDATGVAVGMRGVGIGVTVFGLRVGLSVGSQGVGVGVATTGLPVGDGATVIDTIAVGVGGTEAGAGGVTAGMLSGDVATDSSEALGVCGRLSINSPNSTREISAKQTSPPVASRCPHPDLEGRTELTTICSTAHLGEGSASSSIKDSS